MSLFPPRSRFARPRVRGGIEVMNTVKNLLSAVVQYGGHKRVLARRCTHCTPLRETDDRLDTQYTAQERTRILQLLNNASEEELAAVRLLRGRKAVNIVAHRSTHGPFGDLHSVLNVPMLKHKTALAAFHAILHPAPPPRKVKTQLAKFIKPDVDRKLLKEANSIVSIICGTNKIAWAHVDRTVTVLDWQQQDCYSFMKGAYMASEYLEDVSAVVSRMPAADFFMVEKPGISPQNHSLYPVMTHLRTVEAMLFALLSQSREPRAAPKVLNMMRPAVGRHFGLMVGEARTSGIRMVRDMMMDSAVGSTTRVTFPQELLVRYRNAFNLGTRNRGEELSDALLQAVAFYELLRESAEKGETVH